jgi:thiamine transporter ThiT
MALNPLRTGVVLGLVIGLWHLIWSGLVAVGLAQKLLDFVLWAHFLNIAASITAFDPGLAATLLVATTTVGFATGWVFAVFWNRLHRQR